MNVLPTIRRLCRLALPLALLANGAQAAGDEVQQRFAVLEFRIDGNSKLTDEEIERAVMPFLGESRTLVDVDAARAALEKTYHDAGWLTVSVSIPEQKVDEGEVALQVVEGEVGKLRVKGAKYHANADIRATVPELAEGNVPNFPRMQAELADLNRSADLRVAPVLSAGKVPGTLDVRLETEDELPLHGNLEYNNWQAPNGTPTHLGMNLRYDNLWQLGHSISLTAIVTPEKYDESSQYAVTYVLPLGRQGDALALYAVRSRSKYDTITGSPGLGVVGNVNIFGLRHALTLPRLENFYQSFNYGIDYKDVLQSVSVSSSDSLATPISYAPLAASYSANWLGEGRTTTLAASTVVGLGGVFGNQDAEFANKRSGASASFMTVKGSLQHSETFGRWSLLGKIETQLASGPLVSNEQYFAGGAESVRGYLEGELTGDAGVRMAVQVTTPTLTMGSSTSPWRVAGVAFYEGARLRTLEPVYPQPAYQTIRGTGLGLRLSGAYATQLSLDLARAIDQGITTQAGDYRFYARLLMNF
jgi:hemolysin activation/secretion protein